MVLLPEPSPQFFGDSSLYIAKKQGDICSSKYEAEWNLRTDAWRLNNAVQIEYSWGHNTRLAIDVWWLVAQVSA